MCVCVAFIHNRTTMATKLMYLGQLLPFGVYLVDVNAKQDINIMTTCDQVLY